MRQVDATTHRKPGKVDQNTDNLPTIPHWSDTFTYQGLEYKYTMVGTDPKLGSQTTVIPTEIIPLRFVFPDGSVLDASTDPVDGETAIQRIIESPIFQNYNFVIGGTNVGNTQFGDAYQRANFWNLVSTRSPNYHVLLGQPAVLGTQTVIVPAEMDRSTINPQTGQLRRRVDENYFLDVQETLITQLNISPQTLPILVWGNVTTDISAAEHPTASTPNGIVPYIGTSYRSGSNGFFDFGGDILPLSHEVVEWMDDPFLNSYTPGWNFAFDGPSPRCASSFIDALEVADPVEFHRESEILLPTSSFTYHVTDAVFLDFFTRNSRSQSINGQYDLFNIHLQDGRQVSPTADCVGDVHLTPQLIDVPGSNFTEALGINNHGDVVGAYGDSQNQQHGFVMQNGTIRTLDPPGSFGTLASKINDAGAIVGSFFDGTTVHGFLYKNGGFQQIDFPGSLFTAAIGINSAGDIVGVYNQSQPLARGFLLHNGQFQTVDTPFGANATVDAINDSGSFVGGTWTLQDGSEFGFIRNRSGFVERNMAGALATEITAINNSGMKGGIFVDATYGYGDGFIDLFGYQHEVNNIPGSFDQGIIFYLFVFGNNDLNQIVGVTGDPNSFKVVGYVATLPLQQNAH
jgi:probable HAF family extracellular repeat protein